MIELREKISLYLAEKQKMSSFADAFSLFHSFFKQAPDILSTLCFKRFCMCLLAEDAQQIVGKPVLSNFPSALSSGGISDLLTKGL